MPCWKTNLPGLPETTQPGTKSSSITSVSYHRPNKSRGQEARFPRKPAIQEAVFQPQTCTHPCAVWNTEHTAETSQSIMISISGAVCSCFLLKMRGRRRMTRNKKAPPIKKKKRKRLPTSPQGSRDTNQNSACMPALPMLGSKGKEVHYSRTWRAKPKFPAKYCCQTSHFLSVFVKQIEPVL